MVQLYDLIILLLFGHNDIKLKTGFCGLLAVTLDHPSTSRRCFRLQLVGDDGCFLHLGENCMHCISTWLRSHSPPGLYLTDSIPSLSPRTRRAFGPYPSKIADNILIPNVNVVKAVSDKQRQTVWTIRWKQRREKQQSRVQPGGWEES